MHQTAPVFQVRQATIADASVLAYQRARMFEDMGSVQADAMAALMALSSDYFVRTIPTGSYVAWLMFDAGAPETIVAGAGLLLRTIPPFPIPQGKNAGTLATGRQGLIMNVYVEPAWRRKGLARMLMQEVMAYSTTVGVESLVLHASNEGRALYEQLGFKATNEMRLVQT
jgi:GNAT superfamily N-acetyltransferase